MKRAARDKDLIKLWLCFLATSEKKTQQTFFFFLCFFLLYFGFWRCSVNPIKTIPSAWIARVSLRYCNFFPIFFFFFFLSVRDAFFGQRSADVTVLPRQQEAPQKMWLFSPLILRFGARRLCCSKVAMANEMWRLLKCSEPCSLAQRRRVKSEADVFKRKPGDPWRSHV